MRSLAFVQRTVFAALLALPLWFCGCSAVEGTVTDQRAYRVGLRLRGELPPALPFAYAAAADAGGVPLFGGGHTVWLTVYGDRGLAELEAELRAGGYGLQQFTIERF